METRGFFAVKFFYDAASLQTFQKAPLSQQLIWLGQALGLWLFWLSSSLMSPDRASATGRRLIEKLGPRRHRTKKIRRNLALAFPEKTAAQIEQLVREIWGNFGAVLAEFPHLPLILKQRDPPRIEVVLMGDFQVFANRCGPAIFVTPHLSNWEITAAVAAEMAGRTSVIHNEQDNPLILSMLQRKRRALGCGFVAKDAGLRPILRLLEDRVSIGIIPDQKIRSGEPVPFFGKTALTTINPARLALRFACELIPIQVERLRDAHFRVTFHKPIKPDDTHADRHAQALQMTHKVNALFESWIRESPGQWWCPKNRWPKPLRHQSSGPKSG